MHFDPVDEAADRYFAGLLDGLLANQIPFRAGAFGNPTIRKERAAPSGTLISLGPATSRIDRRFRVINGFLSRAILCAEKPPIVATHFTFNAAPVLCRARQVRHVVHFRGSRVEESSAKGRRAIVVCAKRTLERIVYRSGVRVIATSEASRASAIRRYGLRPERLAVIPCGVDVERFAMTERMAARAILGWPANGWIAICIRRLVDRMGLENLLKAFAQMAAGGDETLLCVGGMGPLSARLEALARELGVANRVRFLGFVPDAQLPLAYAAANLSVVPTEESEGFGLVALESLACGTPALVTPTGGQPETVAGLDRNLILRDSSPASLAGGLLQALRDPGSLPTAERCRSHAEDFSWPKITVRVLEIYQSIQKK